MKDIGIEYHGIINLKILQHKQRKLKQEKLIYTEKTQHTGHRELAKTDKMSKK